MPQNDENQILIFCSFSNFDHTIKHYKIEEMNILRMYDAFETNLVDLLNSLVSIKMLKSVAEASYAYYWHTFNK